MEEQGFMEWLKSILFDTHGITPQGGGVPLSQLRALQGDPLAMPGVGTMSDIGRSGLIRLLRFLEGNTDKAMGPIKTTGGRSIVRMRPYQSWDQYGMAPDSSLPTYARPSNMTELPKTISERNLVDELLKGLGPQVER